MERKNAWEKYPEGKKREEVFQFAEDYRKFISECKTERECTTEFAKRAEKAGFVNLDEVLEKGTKLKAGDRVYANNMGKGIAMFDSDISTFTTIISPNFAGYLYL